MEHSIADSRPDIDPRLLTLLAAPPEADVDGPLGELMKAEVAPAVGRALGSRLRRNLALQPERADLEQECLLRALAFLRLVHARAAAPPARLAAYAATLAHNLVTERLRARQPQRAALKARLRYHLRHHPDLRVEADPAGPRCALAAWERRSGLERWTARIGTASRRAALDADPTLALGLGHGEAARWPLPRACVLLLEHCGTPVELDQLVSWLCELLGVVDRPTASLDAEPLEPRAPAPGEPGVTIDRRRFLEALWREVRELPERQRHALLLNLRDEQGEDALHLLAACGIASLDEIAAALGWTPERLAAVWHELPLEDARLAGELGLARQQVVNLRKSARERLARRLRAQRGPTSL